MLLPADWPLGFKTITMPIVSLDENLASFKELTSAADHKILSNFTGILCFTVHRILVGNDYDANG